MILSFVIGMLALLLLLVSPAFSTIYLSPHYSSLAASLDLGPAVGGLAAATATLAALRDQFGGRNDTTHESRQLLAILLRTGQFRAERVGRLVRRAEAGLGRAGDRTRRSADLNPLHWLGGLTGRVFGLTTESDLAKLKAELDHRLAAALHDEQELRAGAELNSRAISVGVAALQDIRSELAGAARAGDRLVTTDRLFLRLLRARLETNRLLDGAERLAAAVCDVLDRAERGLPSPHLFPPSLLTRAAAHLATRPGLSPLFSQAAAARYIGLPHQCVTSVAETRLTSVLRLPLLPAPALAAFQPAEMQEGDLVVLTSSDYTASLSLAQVAACSVEPGPAGVTVCPVRPCLVRSNPGPVQPCLALNLTTFLLPPGLQATARCGGRDTVLVPGPGTTAVHLPLHCSLQAGPVLVPPVQQRPGPGTSLQPRLLPDSPAHLARHLQPPLTPAPIPAHHTALAVAGLGAGGAVLLLAGVLALLAAKRRTRQPRKPEELEGGKRAPYQGEVELRGGGGGAGCTHCSPLSAKLRSRVMENISVSLKLPRAQLSLAASPSNDSILTFSVPLSSAAHDRMLDTKLELLRSLTDRRTEAAFLHLPAPLPGHTLCLHRVL